MFGREWYKEVLIVIVIVNTIYFVISMFVPFPLSTAIGIILLVVVALWRIHKKKLTIKEATALVLISIGIGIIVGMFFPFSFSLMTYPLIFVTIWWIHKKTSPTMDQYL